MFRHAAVMFFLHISHATPTRLCLNYSLHLGDRSFGDGFFFFFSFLWCLETVSWTLASKSSDGATTSDQFRLALSWPVTRQSPPGVKGALLQGGFDN